MTQLAAPLPKRTLSQSRADLTAALTHPEQLLLNIILPLVALIGLSNSSIIQWSLPNNHTPNDVITPGILAMSIFAAGFAGQAITTGFDRRSGVLAYLATTPLGREGFLLGRTAAVGCQIIIQCTLLTAVAIIIGWQPANPNIAATVVFVALGGAAASALALALAGTLRAEAVLAGANLIWVASLGLGVLTPITMIPSALQPIAAFLPATAIAEGLRDALHLGTFNIQAFCVLCAWTVLGSIITTRWFSWQ